MVKRKKKKWTTKNTHVKRKNKSSRLNPDPMSLYEKIVLWIVIAYGILTIILRALDNNVVGYDNFIGIPNEWRNSLFD